MTMDPPWVRPPGAAARGLPGRHLRGLGSALGRRAPAEAEGHGRLLRLAAGDTQIPRGWNVGNMLGSFLVFGICDLSYLREILNLSNVR